MSARLRCVFYDPDAVDAGIRLSERAFEACARADVEVFALAGDEDAVEVGGERHDVTGEDGAIAFVMRALALTREQCIGVGAALAGAPRRRGVGEPARPRGPRAARARRRGGRRAALRGRDQRAGRTPARLSANRLVRVGQELVQPQAGGREVGLQRARA